MTNHRLAINAFACCAPLLAGLAASAQQAAPAPTPGQVIQAPGGATIVIGPDGQPIVPKGPTGRTGTPPGAPDKQGKPPEAEPGKDQSATGGESASPAVKRPEKPAYIPNPAELKLAPDANGKIRFNFRGQPWPDVLEWLAGVSALSLDWQELPGDYLNLVTQRDYTLAEARDLINRHLLSRGYTMLQSDEMLTVVKVSSLDPGLVPRVEPNQLAARLPHEYVKVSFSLQWLVAETAVEELKPMLSPNGKLAALKGTNRLEAMDAAGILVDLHRVLSEEQSDTGQERLVEEFVLQHARATETLDQLEKLLGIEKKSAAAMPLSPQQMQAMQQQMQMMQQQQEAGGRRGPTPPPKTTDDVQLIANPRQNSILAHAPPDKMAVIAQAVKVLDVPSEQGDSLLAKPYQMQRYRLHTLSPEPLAKTLQELGQLDPRTRLEIDDKNQSLIVYGSLVDHATIRQLVERLDGAGRRFEVMPLRRLAADYVAGTIEFMMIGEQKEEQRPRYFDYYSFRSGGEQTTEEKDKFRVDADLENNLLLVYANDLEIDAIRELLVKLGESPPEGGRTATIRVLESVPPEQSAEFFEKLRRVWPSLSPNELRLPEPPARDAAPEAPPTEPNGEQPNDAKPEDPKPNDPKPNDAAPPARDGKQPVRTTVGGAPFVASATAETVFVAETQPSAEPATAAAPPPRSDAAESSPPASIQLDADGRLVITCRDPRVLDLLEQVIAELEPPQAEYKVFHLKYADAYWVKDNLVEFFKEEDEQKDSGTRRYYYYDSPPPEKKKSFHRLSSRRALKFIYDLDSNSILVQGADARQLRVIEELIAVYDRPPPSDTQSARMTQTVFLRYNKAEVVAEAVKDVFRDLLSSNDKALSGNPEQRQRQSPGTTYIFNEGAEQAPERQQVTFKGKLSLGIDPLTNSLLVSAEGEQLLKTVTTMIEQLDEAAQPLSSVAVVKLSGNVNAERVRAAVAGLLSESPSSAASPEAAANKPPSKPSAPTEPRAAPAATPVSP